jgi:hypothetical protein
MQFDVYRRKSDQCQRIAVLLGAGLPVRVSAGMYGGTRDWELIKGPSQVINDAANEIAARGFCYFKLVARD